LRAEVEGLRRLQENKEEPPKTRSDEDPPTQRRPELPRRLQIHELRPIAQASGWTCARCGTHSRTYFGRVLHTLFGWSKRPPEAGCARFLWWGTR